MGNQSSSIPVRAPLSTCHTQVEPSRETTDKTNQCVTQVVWFPFADYPPCVITHVNFEAQLLTVIPFPPYVERHTEDARLRTAYLPLWNGHPFVVTQNTHLFLCNTTSLEIDYSSLWRSDRTGVVGHLLRETDDAPQPNCYLLNLNNNTVFPMKTGDTVTKV